jgi:hypothetical protein
VQIGDRRHLSAGQVERGDRLVDLAERISLLPQVDHVLVRGIELRELLNGGLGPREGPGWSSMNPRNNASRCRGSSLIVSCGEAEASHLRGSRTDG